MHQTRSSYIFNHKYRQIIIAASLFLVFSLAALVATWQIARDLQQSAIRINLSGRQRMLSQRWTKTLLQLEDILLAEDAMSTELYEEFVTTTELFHSTLMGFLDGGTVTSGDNTLIRIVAIEDPSARTILQNTRIVWQPIYDDMQAFLQAESPADIDQLILSNVRPTLNYALDNNLTLLSLMNELTFQLETLARNNAQRLRTIQITSVLFALINFVFLLLFTVRKLIKTDTELAVSLAEVRKLNLRLEADRNNLSALFEGFMDNSPVSMWIKDPQRRYVRVNDCFANELGHSRSSLAGKRYEDIRDDDYTQTFTEADSAVFEHGETRVDDHDFTTEAGMQRRITTRFPIFDAHGNLYALGGMSVNATDYHLDSPQAKDIRVEQN
ncbi:MAG: PAS domain-containing protein [Deinococcota bacterium]